MPVSKSFAGTTYQIPLNKDPKSTNWGTQVSNFLQALADYALPRTGGSNQLTAELNLAGSGLAGTYGIKLPYLKSATADGSLPAAGFLRLGNTETVQWKGSSSDLSLSVSGSDRLQFAGTNLYQPSDAASTNTASKLVLRDASGNFAAGTITATSFVGPITGNADTATKWQTARTITLGTDLTGSVSIDGSADVTLNATIAANSVALGTDTTGDYVQSISASGAGISISGGTGESSTPAVSLDATLNALAAYNTNGMLTQTAADTFAGRTITGTSNKIVVTNGDGVSGNPTLNIGSDVVTLTDTQTLLNKTTISSTGNATGALKLPSGTAAERPTGVEGYVRYNSDTSSFEGYASGAWSSIGGGGTVDRITQASHGFVLGDILYLSGSTYTKAIATAANTAEVVGMVSRVVDSSTFEMTISGEVTGLSGLTAGEAYFLSPTTAGAMTITEPTTIGQVSLPLGVASSTTSFYVTLKRGNVVGGANARTQINLLNNTTGNIQDVSAYDAGELTGWIYIDATTDLRFYVSAPFAKTGAGTNWNISPAYMGDTPPSGFSISITSAGIIQYTMPSVTGFSTAVINYALNAPAVGTTFPLSVSGSSVIGGTPTVDQINELTSTNGVQIKGRTSGSAIAAGYVGEKITWASAPSTTATPTTIADWTNASIPLTSGTWLVIANIMADAYTAATAGTNAITTISITDSSNNVVQNQEKSVQCLTPANGNMRTVTCLSFGFVANLNASTTYKIRHVRNSVSGNAGNSYNEASYRSEFFAIRIA